MIKINNPINQDFEKIVNEVNERRKNKPVKTVDELLEEQFKKYKYLYPEQIEVIEHESRRIVKLK